MISVLIADDQEEIRGAFRLILEAQPDMRVVAEAADGATAVALARRHRPDVVLADIRMPALDGLAVTRALSGPGVADPIRVVVVTTFDLDEYVDAALRDGACGFLLKRSGPTLLVEAVRAAVAGDALISPQITVRLLHRLARPRAVTTSRAVTEPLTPRETDVARGVAAGRTNAEIAADLYLSPGTVKNHIATVQRKLGVRNRVGIATWAWDNEILTGDPPPAP
ncbi:response regulator [Streptosporangium carneum]|uniref:DNA-binding response regulator n=1 Tax=Streptosporangium carneum TaxID=47481 RepID=A0A9W6HVS1_9ACTN|nr:response regulator transcription factor [Streptosporangium carneum]GLK06681.1 DNA-binding response regulator [Streptosporangium carneum]